MKYYVNKNKQPNGDNEVHTLTCTWSPLEHNRVYLGEFSSCAPAVTKARQMGYKANGCAYCSSSCHTS
ncbi:hypothetical protein ACKB4K_002063 [Vibrio vulnificus]|nr:hypothetical protein [Vibrio vulnificus]ELH9432723.1 hypothetical protein [Vibrio vulnificus]